MGKALGRPRVALNPDFWRGKTVFLTGHTGFIGGWTAAVLHRFGAELHGYALPAPTTPSFFELTRLGHRMKGTLADVRDRAELMRAYTTAKPDVVLHLAAQPLVGIGYANPVETFETNVMGTVNLLDCVRQRRADAVVVMTTDKVYRDSDSENCEDDRLGARDPYGGSKVCCEMVAEVYARSFLAEANVSLATVRAGNVIGGGDWAKDRLIPDAIRAFAAGRSLSLRFPDAARPWQHVLDAVYGLLLVAQRAAGRATGPTAWNVGPPTARSMTVGEVAALAAAAWAEGARVVHDGVSAFAESKDLALDSRRIRRALGYAEPWDMPQILARTMDWYRHTLVGGDAWTLSERQIDDYLSATVAIS
jgi:CDP-glucose 4,6-dehydratase